MSGILSHPLQNLRNYSQAPYLLLGEEQAIQTAALSADTDASGR